MNEQIVENPKTGMYGFMWRVIAEDELYILQRYSKEWNTWMNVQSSFDKEKIIKLYNQIEP